MKVLMLTSSYPFGPADHRGGFVREMARELVRQGIEVEVAVPRPEDGDLPTGDPFPDDGLEPEVRLLPAVLPGRARGFHGAGIESNLASDPMAALAIPPFLAVYAVEASIRGLFCDAIVAHWLLPMGAVGAAIARHSGKPFGIVAHSGPPVPSRVWPFRSVLKQVVSSARSTVCVADSVRREIAGVVGADGPDRRIVLPLGVRLQPSTAAPLSSERPLRLLFVGRLVPIKGLDLLVRAVSRVAGVTLDVAGDGPEASALRALAADLDAPVRFLGAVAPEAAMRAMQVADLLVVPSRRTRLGREEGLPRVLLEAWACGLPVVAASTGGMTEAIARQGGGLLCVPGDVADLARALRLCRTDPAVHRRLRIEALAAGQAYGWEVLGPRWAGWVRSLVRGG